MINGSFLIEWALRSSILIGAGAALLWLLRVKDPSIRLAACIAAVCGSLCLPLLTMTFPKLPVVVRQASATDTWTPAPAVRAAASENRVAIETPLRETPRSSDWRGVLAGLYALIAGLLLLRLGMGLVLARRLTGQSRTTELSTVGVEVRESERVTSPVTVGLIRPVILLPADWRAWSVAKLDAVLAHEQSHVRRRDPAVQFLSALHRALLWHSPLSWVLHRSVVRLAEDVSDDAAVAVTRDRTSYAEMLLEFMQSGVQVNWHGAAMARYGSADARIHRILNSTLLSRGVPRGAAGLICLLAVPLVYVTAAAVPSQAVGAVSNTTVTADSASAVAPSEPGTVTPVEPSAFVQASAASSAAEHPKKEAAQRRYIIVLGNSESGSWDSRDRISPDALRSRFGNRFAWFRNEGAEYVVTDEGVLRDIERAMEPQKKVNAQQDEVNRLQSAVNTLQDKVNARQNDVNGVQDKVNVQQDKVNSAQAAANKRQDLLNRIHDAGSDNGRDSAVKKVEALLNELRTAPAAPSQEEVNRLQAKVNEEQSRVNALQNKVNEEQSRVNAEQGKVNVEQGKVNEVQTKVSAEFHKRIQEIFDSAIRSGLAKTVK
jgi:predicted  nucleic acid-binding Zn-ribbon protein